ncbi:hypothetical protein C2S53_007158 [Perilla frutescens var. hirtella]|uniref:Gag-pol polyprotein n=1 Tax=Perilla frutescens var. hirtella TaxID=608512 RepID=A0AAD4INP8_PERFH|nr:hypothetical protein C2S53_007158 [Perilla frutescens var. hirtella]
MDTMKEGALMVRPPLLDSNNYAYWKARMIAFICSIDERAWKMVMEGWKPPTKTYDKGKTVLKPEEEWGDAEYQIMGLNTKAMNAIFSAVDMNVFKLISTCDKAKDACDILQTTFEGTNSVRTSRMQLLTTRFENLRMDEAEKLADFNAKICDITNESFVLGDAISEEKLVSAYKVTAIEEAKDVGKMKLQELMGSLRTFEMGLTEEETVKKKSIAFQVGSSADVPSNVPDKADIAESIATLSKNFSKFIKCYEKPSQNIPGKNRFSIPRRIKDENSNEEKHKEVKCRECDGYGHYQVECANFLKKKNKSYRSTLSESDDLDDSGSDEKCVSNHIAFMTYSVKESVPASVPDSEVEKISECSDDEEFTEKSVMDAYKKLHSSWLMMVKVNEDLLKENSNLLKERDNLSTRLNELQNELLQSRNCTQAQNGKSPQDHTGLRFNRSQTYDRFCQGQTSGTKDSIVPKSKAEPKNKQQ